MEPSLHRHRFNLCFHTSVKGGSAAECFLRAAKSPRHPLVVLVHFDELKWHTCLIYLSGGSVFTRGFDKHLAILVGN